MNNRVLQFVGKYGVVAVILLLLIAVTVITAISLWPAKPGPRVVLADSRGFALVGLGFSPDCKTFAGISAYVDENGIGGSWGGPVRLWNVSTGQERATLLDKDTQLPDIVYSPNGDLLAMVDGQGELTLWDVKTGREWGRFQVSKVAGVSRWRPNFAFSLDGQTLAFETPSEATVTLWDLTEKRERALLPGASRPVLFSPDGQTLATAYKQSIRFWDMATGKEKATTHGPPVQALSAAFAPAAFAPDGRTFATVSRKQMDEQRPLFQVILWNVSNGAEIAAWETEHEIWWLSLSPDGELLTGRTPNLRPVCWNMSDLTPAPPLLMPRTPRLFPPTAPDQKTCVLVGLGDDMFFWDLARGEKKATLAVHDMDGDGDGWFSPNSQTLAVGFTAWQYDDWLGRATGGMFPGSRKVPAVPPSSGTKLLDVASGKVFATLEGARMGEFSPDSKMLAMRGADGAIQIWDVPGRQSPWPMVLWSLFGILAVAIMGSWLWRARQAHDRPVSSSV